MSCKNNQSKFTYSSTFIGHLVPISFWKEKSNVLFIY